MVLLLDILFNLIMEAVIQLAFELLVALGYESAANSFKERGKVNRFTALLGCTITGGILGLISYVVYPHRIFDPGQSYYGLGLILSPVAAGYVMEKYGRMRMQAGKKVSELSTFMGGALFALAYAAVRFLLIQ